MQAGSPGEMDWVTGRLVGIVVGGRGVLGGMGVLVAGGRVVAAAGWLVTIWGSEAEQAGKVSRARMRINIRNGRVCLRGRAPGRFCSSFMGSMIELYPRSGLQWVHGWVCGAFCDTLMA